MLHKVTCLHNNAPSQTGKPKPVGDILEALSWKVIPHAGYSPDLALSDYHLLASMSSRICCTTLRFVRRCEKMARWMVRRKGGRFLLARYSQIARKMVKMYNKRWSMFWIKHFFIILPNLTCFLDKDPHFILAYLVSFQMMHNII